MRLSLPISLSLLPLLLLFAAQKAGAQLAPADDFFNSGAQFYISNNIPAALERAEIGLKLYPDDEKLKKLEELLKQQQQSQQNRSKINSRTSRTNRSNKNRAATEATAAKSAATSKSRTSRNKNRRNRKKQNSRNNKSSKNRRRKKRRREEDKQEAEGQPVQPGEMTPEEAKRLLDAQKGNEQVAANETAGQTGKAKPAGQGLVAK